MKMFNLYFNQQKTNFDSELRGISITLSTFLIFVFIWRLISVLTRYRKLNTMKLKSGRESSRAKNKVDIISEERSRKIENFLNLPQQTNQKNLNSTKFLSEHNISIKSEKISESLGESESLQSLSDSQSIYTNESLSNFESESIFESENFYSYQNSQTIYSLSQEMLKTSEMVIKSEPVEIEENSKNHDYDDLIEKLEELFKKF
ncbi:MAG: hypothetical protein LBI13_02425 [Streptococcaceae bacterium]|nr:hypothetical protein [Streptococcaceae bacterium]